MKTQKAWINPYTQKAFEWVETDQHPVRYVALDVFPACARLNEKVLHSEQAHFWTEAGYYWHPMKNQHYTESDTTEGIYAHIYMRHDQKLSKKHPKYRQAVGFLVEASAYLPNALRLQKHWSDQHVVNFPSAMMMMETCLIHAYTWQEDMMKKTAGRVHIIQWGRRDGGFVLSPVGMTRFLSDIFPKVDELKRLITKDDAGDTFCPTENFDQIQDILGDFDAWGEIVGR